VSLVVASNELFIMLLVPILSYPHLASNLSHFVAILNKSDKVFNSRGHMLNALSNLLEKAMDMSEQNEY
jgi:hypothetical protein